MAGLFSRIIKGTSGRLTRWFEAGMNSGLVCGLYRRSSFRLPGWCFSWFI